MPMISMFPAGAVPSGLPEFTYTGTAALMDDGDGNWRIKCFTSGTLAITSANTTVDAFLVGGGGGGGSVGGGGGSGYTVLQSAVVLSKGTAYPVVIGAGGTGGAAPTNGGKSTAFGYTANAGRYGCSSTQAPANADRIGGNGGSGGGGYNTGLGGTGGTDGGTADAAGGTGQGTTTREFHETAGALYASGGNAALASPTAGAVNTGNGGGGGTAGGSGIVIIRNHAV